MDRILAHSRKILFATAVFVLSLIAVCIYLSNVPDRDMVNRYIPMAEAFACRDFVFAFHPRIPPLQPLCGGIVAKCFGVDAFLGLKIASAMWHVLGGVLIWILFHTLYPEDRKVALFGTILYCFFPYIFHMSYSGLRESAKCTLLILLALAMVRISRSSSRWWDYLLLGLAAGLGALTRAELTAVGMFCIFCAAIFEGGPDGVPRRSFLASAAALFFWVGNAMVNYHFFGHAMVDVRFARMFLKLTGRAAGPVDALAVMVLIAFLLPVAAYAAKRIFRRVPVGYFWGVALLFTVATTVFTIVTGGHGKGEVGNFFISLLEGVYYFIVPMALVHVGRQVFLHKFSREEHALLLVAASQFLLCILQIQIFGRKLDVSSRYLYSTPPLFLGFFLLAWEDFYRWFSAILPKWCVKLMLAASIGGFVFMYVYHVPQPLYREYHDRSQLADKAAIGEICALIAEDDRPLRSHKIMLSPWEYRSRRLPKIWFNGHPKISVAVYFVGGSATKSVAEADYIVSAHLPKRIRHKNARLLGLVRGRKGVLGVWRIR